MTAELPDHPESREESYLAAIAGEDVVLPEEPLSRKEQYLAYIAENGGGGGGGTNNFNQLTNRPKYNSTTMTGSTNIPKVPTKTSELSNDSNFVSSSDLPTVNDATLTITQNGVSAGTFTANDADNTTIALTDTTYNAFTGTDGTSAGAAGLVPAPATTDAGKFLKADGTWDTAGGGSGPTVVQTTGTSTTDVMSQNAVTSMVYADPSNGWKIQLGKSASVSGPGSVGIGAGGVSCSGAYSVALGYGSSSASRDSVALGSGAINSSVAEFSVALGNNSNSAAGHSVAIGSYSKATMKGQVDISTLKNTNTYGYNNSQYRLLTGLYAPQSAHDAANKEYVDPTTDSSAPTTATVGRLGQIFIDTTNADAYMCVAVDSVTPSYTWKKINA